MTNPIAAVGIVWGVIPNGDDALPAMLGSCFLFQSDSFALTAAHCVPEGLDIYCEFPLLEEQRVRVLTVVRHPTADIAILQMAARVGEESTVESHVRLGVDPAYGFSHTGAIYLGADVVSFGYPSELTSLEMSQIQPRLFKGHVQTVYTYRQHRFKYDVAELSFPAPGGLSGAPAFRAVNGGLVIGMITTNHDSARVTDSIDEITQSGTTLRIEGKRIVSYAIALLLSSQKDWLDQTIPPIVVPPR